MVRDFFGTLNFDHELKVGRVSLFLELAPQTVLHYGTKTGRFVVRDFRACDLSEQKTALFVARIFLGLDLL